MGFIFVKLMPSLIAVSISLNELDQQFEPEGICFLYQLREFYLQGELSEEAIDFAYGAILKYESAFLDKDADPLTRAQFYTLLEGDLSFFKGAIVDQDDSNETFKALDRETFIKNSYSICSTKNASPYEVLCLFHDKVDKLVAQALLISKDRLRVLEQE